MKPTEIVAIDWRCTESSCSFRPRDSRSVSSPRCCFHLARNSRRAAETAADAGHTGSLVVGLLAKYASAFSMALFTVNIPGLMLRDLDFLVGHPTLSTTFTICQSASR